MRKMNHMLSAIAASLLLTTAIGGASAQQDPAASPDSAPFDVMSAEDPPTFDAPAAAVEAFRTALSKGDFDGLAQLLGLDAAKLKASEGATDTFADMQKGAIERLVAEPKGDQQIIEIGKQNWPMPFPLVKGSDGKWAFDTEAGIQEVIDRRIGENEEEAIATVQAYVDAQEDYLVADRDGDGVLEYAQKLISSDGEMDGLYWPEVEGSDESPAGAFADESQRSNVEANRGYYGYRFRVLTAQGDNVLGGDYDYRINDNMIVGHALVAWPVTYGETGVQTFVVNKEGIVYQADLGPDTDKAAQAMTQFNPDDKWQVVPN